MNAGRKTLIPLGITVMAIGVNLMPLAGPPWLFWAVGGFIFLAGIFVIIRA